MDFSENADKKVSIYIDVLFFLEYALIITIMYVVPSTFFYGFCVYFSYHMRVMRSEAHVKIEVLFKGFQ